MQTLTSGKDLLFLLVLKVGLAASMAALLARSATFRKVLYTEMRNSEEKMQLLLFMAPTLVVGVFLRLVGYRFADLTLEGAFLLGILGGSVAGSIGGAIVSLPAFFFHEWLATPMAVLAGALGGLIRAILPNHEAIWNFGPFLFLGIPRWMFRVARNVRVAWEMVPLAAVIALELGRIALSHASFGRPAKPNWLFVLDTPSWWTLALVVLTTVMAVAVPIKIWNNTRIEAKLKQHEDLLLNARMTALASQINPHFLFNTLNTVSSLIRYNPDLARGVLLKLSSILRRLLRKQENFVPLREELGFIDDYLDIEVARFGPDKLQISKELDEDTLEAYVPCMLLQPIVENSIKHGLAPKVGGGEICIRTARRDGRLLIEVEDNGLGMPPERISALEGDGVAKGIGISNVHERLRVLYGDDFRFDIHSVEGKGTFVRIDVPDLVPVLESSS
ncbi:MAG: histidine kinase [Acidobacteria bacterium]|nr:histidine kinase [Acidobacteriota bacterium]MCL5286823.1 histidine kinase [Acidobacteriota bacterium]